MGNKQWRKLMRYQRHVSLKRSATAVSQEVQTDPVHICDPGPSLLHGWNDNAFFRDDGYSKSNNSFDLDMDRLNIGFHDRSGKLASSSTAERWDVSRELFTAGASAEDGRKKMCDGESSQSYWGDTSSAELDDFLVAETLCNDRDFSDSEFAIDAAVDNVPDPQDWPSDRKVEKTVAPKAPAPDKEKVLPRKEGHQRHLHASSVGRPGFASDKNLQYTFYVDDVDQVKKPFYDRRICALINIDGCNVTLLDREANDKKRTYYKGTPVRPVVITAPSMSALRRCLGRIDTQFPHFNAKAFLRE